MWILNWGRMCAWLFNVTPLYVNTCIIIAYLFDYNSDSPQTECSHRQSLVTFIFGIPLTYYTLWWIIIQWLCLTSACNGYYSLIREEITLPLSPRSPGGLTVNSLSSLVPNHTPQMGSPVLSLMCTQRIFTACSWGRDGWHQQAPSITLKSRRERPTEDAWLFQREGLSVG